VRWRGSALALQEDLPRTGPHCHLTFAVVAFSVFAKVDDHPLPAPPAARSNSGGEGRNNFVAIVGLSLPICHAGKLMLIV